MLFAEFYGPSTGWNGKDFSGPIKLIPRCGNSSVAVLDGRLRPAAADAIAKEICIARGHGGYTINRGVSFTQSRVIVPLTIVRGPKAPT